MARYRMDVQIDRSSPDGKVYVSWTCPKCKYRNERQRWFGREFHVCSACEEWTDIKGEVQPAVKVKSNVTPTTAAMKRAAAKISRDFFRF